MTGTQNITILFTDLVGSTELSTSLAPGAADEVRRAHFSLLRQAISTSGGTEVKNLGDGLMVSFGATAPALSCAVEMQQAIERDNRRSPVNLAIRIGISTGDVTEEDGDYFGDPVVEAARLCAAAQGDQILTTDIVKGLARRSGHSFITERELDLKGLPDPVIAWEVVWERAIDDEHARMPLPPRLPVAPAAGFIGRAHERTALDEARKSLAAGEFPCIVLVSGEAGMGKSTLTSSFARAAHHDGAVVLYGRCDEEVAVPYRPFVEALHHCVTHVEDAVLTEIGADHLAALVHLVPALRKRFPHRSPSVASDPDAERWLLFGAVVALVEHVAAEAPVVLVLDDLHWADAPTLQLLRHMAGHLVGRVLVVGTYRDVELSASQPLTQTLAAFARESRVTRLALSGLDDTEVISLMEAAAGHAMDGEGVDLAHALYRETDGNPFFVAEVLRHLVETRAIVQDETGRWVPTRELAAAGLPDSVRQVIGARVARLGEDASRLLSAASVLGQEFEVGVLARMSEAAEDAALDVLEAAESAALVTEVRDAPGRFRFAHALIQHTLYEDLGRSRRARLHRAAGEALEDRLGAASAGPMGEIARHWLAATRPEDPSKAVTYARLAGEEALAVLAPDEAIRWFNEALSAGPHVQRGPEGAGLLAGLGEAQRQTGDPAYRETLLEAGLAAQKMGDVDTLVRAALANNRGFVSAIGQVDTARLEMLHTALDAVGTADSTARARLLALLAAERAFDGDFAGRREVADDALAMARRVGDPATVLDVLLRRSLALWVPATVESLLASAEEAEALADEIGDPVGQFWAAGFRTVFAIQLADLAQASRCLHRGASLALEVGQPILRWCRTFSLSWLALLTGDMAAAEDLASEALQIGTETGQPDALSFYGAQLFTIRYQQGRLDEIAQFIAEVEAANPGLPVYRGLAALTAVETGRNDAARPALEAESGIGFSAPDDYLRLTYLDQWARVASRVGDPRAAQLLYDRLKGLEHLTIFTGTTVLGTVAHNLGALASVLGRNDDADAHFANAQRLNESLHAPFLITETQLAWARALLARLGPGDAVRARTLLVAALETAVRFGFPALERDAGETLAALG